MSLFFFCFIEKTKNDKYLKKCMVGSHKRSIFALKNQLYRIMKNKNLHIKLLCYALLTVIGFSTIALSSCGDKEEEELPFDQMVLNVATTLLEVGPQTEMYSVEVESNMSVAVASNDQWLRAEVSGDNKKIMLYVPALPNDVWMRVAEVRIRIGGNWHKERTLKVKQVSDSHVFNVSGNGKSAQFRMQRVSGGRFWMGNNSGYEWEGPVHEVTLTKGYYICDREVTQALWYAIMGRTPTSDYSKQWSESLGLGDEYPAYYVSYDDCKDFITALNTKLSDQLPEGVSFRLPTEAEWEFAAKGGLQTHGYMYAGSDSINDVGWYRDNSNFDIHKVAMKAPNELGLYDMTGNLEEWCFDVYDNYSSYEQTNPTGPNSGYRRVVRGGNYCLNPNQCTNTYRNTDSYLTREHFNGMRLALD